MLYAYAQSLSQERLCSLTGCITLTEFLFFLRLLLLFTLHEDDDDGKKEFMYMVV